MLGFRGAMCSRQHTQACLNTSLSIRQEIQRFESVHPSIYALYDLVELVPDPLLAQQIRDHVVAIEGLYLYPLLWSFDIVYICKKFVSKETDAVVVEQTRCITYFVAFVLLVAVQASYKCIILLIYS